MNEQPDKPSTQGVMIAAALVMAAMYILSGSKNNFAVTFTKDKLPLLLIERIFNAKAVLITASFVTNDVDTDEGL